MKKLFLLLLLSLALNSEAAITTNRLLSAQVVTNLINSKFSADISLTNGSLYVSSLVSSTNGFLLMARDNIPTNLIPSSTTTRTNYLLFNWTNVGVVLIATNINAAGSFLIQTPMLTPAIWP